MQKISTVSQKCVIPKSEIALAYRVIYKQIAWNILSIYYAPWPKWIKTSTTGFQIQLKNKNLPVPAFFDYI